MAALRKILFLLGRRLGTAQTRHLNNSQHIHVANPWHAVSIVTARPSCPVCGQYKHVRFLAKEAPPLPLRGCPDPKACQTVYKHYPDRRAGPRRALERRAFQPMNPTVVIRNVAENRRSSNGRRSTDGR
ncbi:MAG TPA: hypothetical protein VGH84_05095 [Steroidobacteraceae bacterium]|jgi:hypothetical protein